MLVLGHPNGLMVCTLYTVQHLFVLYSRGTEIMMPGDLGGKEHSVQIARFEGSMLVLPTKTKPKKFR